MMPAGLNAMAREKVKNSFSLIVIISHRKSTSTKNRAMQQSTYNNDRKIYKHHSQKERPKPASQMLASQTAIKGNFDFLRFCIWFFSSSKKQSAPLSP